MYWVSGNRWRRQDKKNQAALMRRRLNYTKLNYLRPNFHFYLHLEWIILFTERPRCISSWVFGYDSQLDKTIYSWSSLAEKRILTHQP
jgi:hypothetical protein